MIDLKGVAFQDQGSERFALKDVNVSVAPGEFVGIIGPSGAGKTTLTQVLNGIVPHHRVGDFYGHALIAGRDTVTTLPAELARTVGSVFQDIEGQFVSAMVEDELLYALENFGFDRAEIPGRIERALEAMGIAPLRHRSLGTLSGGQKQKVALASTMALSPRLLVLDEPTGELDPQSSLQVFELLRGFQRDLGTTVVVVEQKIMLLCAFVHRLIVLKDGQVALDGPVREVLERAELLEEIGINCPRVTTLASRLKARGWYQGPAPLNVDEGEQVVRQVLSRREVMA
ncbi:MAG TPA: ABC transporter ATP-binding protein [Clostridia bacterium]|nr:ABC transporter ATP-binding protein [Clostridia bacterium]